MADHPPFRRIRSPYHSPADKVFYYFCGILPVHKHLTVEDAEKCLQDRTEDASE
jgi:hypothetical protein